MVQPGEANLCDSLGFGRYKQTGSEEMYCCRYTFSQMHSQANSLPNYTFVFEEES